MTYKITDWSLSHVSSYENLLAQKKRERDQLNREIEELTNFMVSLHGAVMDREYEQGLIKGSSC